jgi:hypothetical protein
MESGVLLQDHGLSGRMYRREDHLTDEHLDEFAAFRMTEPETHEVYMHLRQCSQCDGRYWSRLGRRFGASTK